MKSYCCRLSSFLLHFLLHIPISSHGFVVAPPGMNRFKLQSRPLPVIHNNRLATSSIEVDVEHDRRPFAQRVSGPRTARRLNHAFRYLYRHYDGRTRVNELSQNQTTTNAFEFLTQTVGYTAEEVYEMHTSFPPLLDLHVQRHFNPKLLFLLETLKLHSMAEVREHVPPQYFGARLERTIAPRHAFLVWKGLYSCRDLILVPTRWQEFLLACRKPKQFCALCNQWQREVDRTKGRKSKLITMKEIEAFDASFQRGLMAAARNEPGQHNARSPLDHAIVSSADLINLLIQHGANPLERDARGSSLLHWAAGTDQLDNVKILLPLFEKGVFEATARDGALPLHWAAAGANAREFGIGGHVQVCRYLLDQVDDVKGLVNHLTKDGNSALMWSAWATSLDVVKLLVRNRADPFVTNRNGCSVAHWAASGGNVDCCRYLYETVGVDFTCQNHGGNSPLTHAVAFGRAEVVKWLRNDVLSADNDDIVAASLAQDFVTWTEGDEKRQLVLSLFEGWGEGIDMESITG
jgi:hypothetical protein